MLREGPNGKNYKEEETAAGNWQRKQSCCFDLSGKNLNEYNLL